VEIASVNFVGSPRRSSKVSFSKFSVVSSPGVIVMISGAFIELLEMGLLYL